MPFISERSVGGNVEPRDMLAELCSDNQALIVSMRAAHELCDADNRGFTFRHLESTRGHYPAIAGSSLNKTNAFKRYGPGSARAVSQILLPNVYSASRCELDRRRIDYALLGVWASLPMD